MEWISVLMRLMVEGLILRFIPKHGPFCERSYQHKWPITLLFAK